MATVGSEASVGSTEPVGAEPTHPLGVHRPVAMVAVAVMAAAAAAAVAEQAA